MDKSKAIICPFPDCQNAIVGDPAELEGQTMECKKCGGPFQITVKEQQWLTVRKTFPNDDIEIIEE